MARKDDEPKVVEVTTRNGPGQDALVVVVERTPGKREGVIVGVKPKPKT